MKEIFVDINDYNKSFITATESDNNSDVYKIIITEDGRRFDLTEKTVQMAYAISYTDKGDILNLNITNPTEGEITLEITNELTRKDGDYTCQLLILGENEYRRHSKYYFNLSIRENLFNKISGEIIESPSIGILQELVKKAEFLNTQLENNNNVAESLNTNLAENIKLAGPLNTSLNEKIPEAATKKNELESSIVEAKKFIDGLDGSQNIPGIRMELTELQNGLKSNQALAYSGSSVSANGTLEGRTESMKICGMTLFNCMLTPIINRTYTANSTQQMYNYKVLRKANATYTIIAFISKNTLNNSFSLLSWGRTSNGNPIAISTGEKGLIKKSFTTNDNTEDWFLELWKENTTGEIKIDYMMVLEGDWTNKDVPSYFEGIKSFGEAEQEGDKYKISILSYTGNLLDIDLSSPNVEDGVYYHYVSGVKIVNNDVFTSSIKLPANTRYSLFNINRHVSYWVGSEFKGSVKNNFTDNVFTTQVSPPYDCTLKVTVFKVNKNSAYCTLGDNKLIPWQPYKKPNKKDILISAPLPGFDFGEDIMYEENGQVKITRNIDTYTFTGDETIRDTTEQDEKSGTGKYKVFILTINKTIDKNKNINNNFPKKQFSVAFQKVDSEGLAITQYGVYIKILKSKLSTQDTEGFKAWLKANTTTIYFARATPVTEIVENCVDIDLDTYQEKTYFNILNSLPGTLDFKVPSNIGSVVQNMAKEVNNIWDVINNLLVPGLIDTKKNLALKTIKNNLK